MGGSTGSVISPLGDGLTLGLSVGLTLGLSLGLVMGLSLGLSGTSGADVEVEQPATTRAAANPREITACARPIMSDSMPQTRGNASHNTQAHHNAK